MLTLIQILICSVSYLRPSAGISSRCASECSTVSNKGKLSLISKLWGEKTRSCIAFLFHSHIFKPVLFTICCKVTFAWLGEMLFKQICFSSAALAHPWGKRHRRWLCLHACQSVLSVTTWICHSDDAVCVSPTVLWGRCEGLHQHGLPAQHHFLRLLQETRVRASHPLTSHPLSERNTCKAHSHWDRHTEKPAW